MSRKTKLSKTFLTTLDNHCAAYKWHTAEALKSRATIEGLLRGKGFGIDSKSFMVETGSHVVEFTRQPRRVFDQEAIEEAKGIISPEIFASLFEYKPAGNFDVIAEMGEVYGLTRELFTVDYTAEHIAVYTAKTWKSRPFYAKERTAERQRAAQERKKPKGGKKI